MDIYEIRQELSRGRTLYELPLRVTFYARVSTDKEEQLHSLAAQVQYYRDLIGKIPSWQMVEGYVDEGISGTSVKKREQFLQMIEDAEAHCFDFIVTKEISRFSRSTLDSIRYTQQLLKCGVGVFFQSDNINTLMPDAELRLTIMSSIAQDEVRKISERVKFGFRRAVERGVVLGSNRIWGYRKQEGRLVVVEEEAEIVRTIFDLYANEQLGVRRIAERLTAAGYRNSNGNPFSFSTIRGILANPKYKGYYCGGKSTKIDYKLNRVKNFPEEQWVQYEDRENVPAIVSEALWEKANRLLRQRAENQRAEGSSGKKCYAYSGKILCGTCKSPCYRGLYRYKNGDREVWKCQKASACEVSTCNGLQLYTDEIGVTLRKVLEEYADFGSALSADLLKLYRGELQGGGNGRKLEKLRRKQAEIHRRKDRLLDLNAAGQLSDDEFKARNEGFNRDIQEVEFQLSVLQKEQENQESPDAMLEKIRLAMEQELTFQDGFSIGTVGALLNRAELYPGKEKSCVELLLHLQEPGEIRRYHIRRQRGKPSVCTESYT